MTNNNNNNMLCWRMILVVALWVLTASAFQPMSSSSVPRIRAMTLHSSIGESKNEATPRDDSVMIRSSSPTTTTFSRSHFMSNSLWLAVVAASMTTTWPSPALARGRATLQQSYDRYTPRIVAGGAYYGSDLRKMIERNDFAGIAQATAEPPKKSKQDRSKVDGGVADRAAQAGAFSESRVVVACELFASAFSDNTPSAKTKKMLAQVDVLRSVVEEINAAAQEALPGSSSSGGGGGLFGFGASKKASPAELAQKIRKLYVQGGNAWNQYIFAANEELPIQFAKLPYLK